MDKDALFFDELIGMIKKKRLSKQRLSSYKMVICKKYGRKAVPTDIETLLRAKEADIPKIRQFLQTKPVRTGSGVAVIAIMTKPAPCPHGKCAMCPGGLDSSFGDVPQSYTGNEPATMRGMRNNYDPYLQVMNRLEQYVILGQDAEKVELIVMGGTFPSLPRPYQEEFVMYAFKAMNDFSRMFFRKGHLDVIKFRGFFKMPGEVASKERVDAIQHALFNMKKTSTLEREQKKNETAVVRCIGLTVETRPDWGRKSHGLLLLRLGCTRVELGIQSVFDEALARLRRGHSIKDSVDSIRELKDLGFKLNFHIMPGIPGIDRKKDLKGLKALFEDESYRPDMLKIYPLMVMPGTLLYDEWKKGLVHPLSTKDAAELIARFKRHIPPYCRIMRVQRDIPSKFAAAGVDRNNLRQYVSELMKGKGWDCGCIRCREIGNRPIRNPQVHVYHYTASHGNEFFISIDSGKRLVGFCRLRFPSSFLHPAITPSSAIVRELHVYAPAVNIGKKAKKGEAQHKGIGRRLLLEAERIARTYYKDRLVVISGIGAREYYKRLGYKKGGPYMVKKLQ